MDIQLTQEDKEYAIRHKISFRDMKGMVEDQIVEEETSRAWEIIQNREALDYYYQTVPKHPRYYYSES